MFTGIRLTLLLCLAAPMLFFATDAYFKSSDQLWSAFMQSDYEEKWKAVDKALDEGLPKTALEMVEVIYAKAEREENIPQFVKAVTYRVRLRAVMDDEDEVVLVRDLEKEVARAKQPVRSILQSMLATVYWNHYQSNRWQISQRTQVEDAPEQDFRTWDASRFFDTTRALYLQSVENATLLQDIPAEKMDVILHTASESKTYRPTLYDILVQRAVEFLANDETSLPKPQRPFELNDLSALGPVEDFLQQRFESPDPGDARYNVLLLYQRLLAFHRTKNNVEPLVDADLQRLAYARRNTFHEDKDTTYVQAVEALAQAYRSWPVSVLAGHAIATWLYERGDYVAAMARCEKEIALHPRAPSILNCRALIQSILEKELQLDIEESVRPDAPFIVSTVFRNLREVHFRIVAFPNAEYGKDWTGYRSEESREDWIRSMLHRPAVHNWTAALPTITDYKQHRVDMRAPGLELGTYLVAASADKDFSTKGNAIVYAWLQVSRLSLQAQERDGDWSLWVNDAVDGRPLPGVKADMFSMEWGRNGHNAVFQGTSKTDANGHFFLGAKRFDKTVSVRLTQGKDTLTVGEGFYAWRAGRPTRERRTMFFTDRALYRPGQTIHVKGILIEGTPDKADYTVVKNTRSTVTLLDANHQKVSEQTVTSNEYGSFNLTFTAPSGVLRGVMTIQNEWGSTVVRVEEYKRPKFEVTFLPMSGTPALLQTVTAKGNAKMYAGSNVDGATVQWRVVRNVRWPYWFWWWYPAPRSEAREIAHGSAVTDADGNFSIDFAAIPDKSIPKSDLPVFSYEITADVTDINGETHSANTTVRIGYTSVELAVEAAEHIDATRPQAFQILANNLAGQPVAVNGTVTVERLRVPARITRKRTLPRPDAWLLSKADFEKSFPLDVYKDEENEDRWPVDATVLERSFATGDDGRDSIALSTLAPGRYRITAKSKDPGGTELVMKRFVTVYKPADKEMPFAANELFIPMQTTVEPGESATFLLGTSFAPARVLYRVLHRDRVTEERWLELSREQRAFSIPIREEHRGGLVVQLCYVRDYRVYSRSVSLYVPWSNKDIEIETATFRDKLQPGQKEEWTLTVKGKGRDRVAAELLASMYDASLDAIYRQEWPGFAWPTFTWANPVGARSFGTQSGRRFEEQWNPYTSTWTQSYDRLNLFLLDRYGYLYGRGGVMYDAMSESDGARQGLALAAPSAVADKSFEEPMLARKEAKNGRAKDEAAPGENEAGSAEANGGDDGGLGTVKARTDFSETVFFYPTLGTDAQGNVLLRFTMPEALTRWKLRVFAHTPDLMVGALQKSTVTQKELMVLPNMPRFLREGDRIVLSTKISNLSDGDLRGRASLQLLDALTLAPLGERFALKNATRDFTVEKGRSTMTAWEVTIPEGISAVTYRIVAKAGNFSDGEEMALPILPNRMLVTETMPIWVRGGQSKTFSFDKLRRAGASGTLRHHQLSLEMTSQPAWYAVQALPYLMEFPYECSEQVFNRYYANSIAAHIVNSNPKIKRVFEQWKNTDALLSNLQKNQDLKMLLLEETPWVMQGKDESERKKRIALLFDLNGMADNLESALRKLEKAQGSGGGWPWFPGLPEDRYITQYLIAGFGHLRALGVEPKDERVSRMLRRAVQFVDREMHEDYLRLKRTPGFDPEKDHLGYIEAQYLYARSFFLEQKHEGRIDESVNFWLAQARRWWPRRNYYTQGMIALGLHRRGDKQVPPAVVKSLRERALRSDEMGMYWKYERGWFWYQAPIETQAMLIEVFDDIARDVEAVEEMKIWLLRQKQVQDWKTTVATAEACYALLRRGSDLLASDKLVEVTLGDKRIDPLALGAKVEAGTGYYRVDWRGKDIDPDMGRVTLNKSDKGIAWGALYWQYFEQLDRITPAETPLKIEKTLYRKRATDKGVVLEPVTAAAPLRVGDVLTARITLRVDRDMEYVHMKDMRGAGLELMNQLSGRRYQQGLVYYEAPGDAAVNFFFSWLRKGVHVFEYSLRVAHAGRFSNGISSVQSMYAPEFAAHTAGVVVEVK